MLTSLDKSDGRRLSQLRRGESGVLAGLELPESLAERLMVMGFVPGAELRPAGCAPGGDPRVYRVDGAEVALRRDTAARLVLKSNGANGHG